MVTDVDKLSDEELRSKLMEYGFPALPVTGTTRKVMLKKLKLLLENKPSTNDKDGRRSLGRYSSGEDSDAEVRTSKRRATIGVPSTMQPPSSSKPTLKKVTKIVETTIEEDIPKKEVTRVSTRSSRIVKNALDEFDTGSESETEVLRRSTRRSKGRDTSISENTSYETFSSTKSDSINDTENYVEQIKSKSSNLNRTPPYSSSILRNVEPKVDKVETPYLSNFTRRLSQLSASRLKKEELETNGTKPFRRTIFQNNYNSPSKPTEYSSVYTKSNNDGNFLKDKLIPTTVLVIAVLFFIFVGFMYLGLKPDTDLISKITNTGKKMVGDKNPYE